MRDRDQNSWQLASIQTASLGMPGIILSPMLANKYGPEAVLSSIFIASLILWFIAFTITSMAAKGRKNAIENAEAYIGKYGAWLAALISMAVFLTWFVLQMQATAIPIDHSLYGEIGQHGFMIVIILAILGALISLITLTGLIRLVKNLCVFFIPILMCYYLYRMIFTDSSIPFPRKLEFSLPCTVAYISFLFPGMVNLPTFFRHARSKYDAHLGLTLMIIIVVALEISSIWMSPDVLSGSLFKNAITDPLFFSLIMKITNIVFAVMLLLCSNLVNIYFASPGWELIIPNIKKPIQYIIIGLVGTTIYALNQTFTDFIPSIHLFESYGDNFIANLGTALLLIFGVRIIVRHRPKPFEKLIGATSWVVGCVATLFATTQNSETPPLLVGIGATIFFFLLIIFIEEPFWSLKKLKEWRDKKKKI